MQVSIETFYGDFQIICFLFSIIFLWKFPSLITEKFGIDLETRLKSKKRKKKISHENRGRGNEKLRVFQIYVWHHGCIIHISNLTSFTFSIYQIIKIALWMFVNVNNKRQGQKGPRGFFQSAYQQKICVKLYKSCLHWQHGN